jgi:DNA-directed RNA polymerase specialized sigma24 family protein
VSAYAGAQASIHEVDPDGDRIVGDDGGLSDVEFQIDLALALSTLTQMQRICFVEVEINGRTQRSVANGLGITQQAVNRHLRAAKQKLKIFFRDRL